MSVRVSGGRVIARRGCGNTGLGGYLVSLDGSHRCQFVFLVFFSIFTNPSPSFGVVSMMVSCGDGDGVSFFPAACEGQSS